METPLVSVCCTTFNHQKYVKKAIEGFLMQQTTFPVEIIIHDDASTDNTVAIIESFAKKDKRIVTILQKVNQYSQQIKPWPNYVFPKARGKYIALCEGDDYWTDQLKLQKQVDFLEANPDYGICFHNAQILNDNTGELRIDDIKPNVPEITKFEDLLLCNYIFTPTAMLRNDFEIPNWYYHSIVGDWPLYFIQIKDRKIKKMDDVMAVYRENNTGVWSLISREKQLNTSIKINEMLLENLTLKDEQKEVLKKNIYHLNKTILKHKRRESSLINRFLSFFKKQPTK